MISAPNYTQIPNFLLDHLILDLTHLELKVLLLICRKTFGWHKVRDHISLTQFEKSFHSSRSHIKEALDSLQIKNLIIKTQTGSQSDGSVKNYYELVIDDPSAEPAPPPSAQNDTTPSAPRAPTKESSYKRKGEEEIKSASPPDFETPLSIESKLKREKAKEKRESSPDARDMAKKLLYKLEAMNPTIKKPDLAKWALEIDLLNRVDKRSWEDISLMIDWAMDSEFWVKIILSPHSLRKSWDRMFMQKNPANNKGAQSTRNRKSAQSVKDHLTKKGHGNLFWIGNDYVRNTKNGDTITFDLVPETFEEILCKWFNLTRE